MRVRIPSSPLHFVKIDARTATALVKEHHHYLHRQCPISFAWGIEDADKRIVGVLTIGKLMSWSVRCGLVGEHHEQMNEPGARSKDVYELNRLWIADEVTEDCIESRFIAWCLRRLKKQYPNIIVVSYADGAATNPITGKNHVGFVYKACGFHYVGQSHAFRDITIEGIGDHRSVPQELRGGYVYACVEHGKFPTPYSPLPYPPTKPCHKCRNPARRLNWRSWTIQDYVTDAGGKKYRVLHRIQRSAKHRYVWLADPKDERLLKGKWKRKPYPKEAAKR
jgi:hypothetical protein